MPLTYYAYLPAAAANAHRTSGLATVGIVLVYLVGQGALVALTIWYGVRAGADGQERALRRWTRRHRGLTDELRSLDDSLTQLWTDEVDAGRRRAGRDARRLISGSIPLVDFRVTALRHGDSCTRLTFADGTVLVLWSSEPGCARNLRHLPPNAVIQYLPPDGCDSVSSGPTTPRWSSTARSSRSPPRE